MRGDLDTADPEAFFARRGAVALGESVLTLECNVKEGTPFRLAQFRDAYIVCVRAVPRCAVPCRACMCALLLLHMV